MLYTTDVYFLQFWRTEVPNQGAQTVKFWCEPSSWFAVVAFSLYVHTTDRDHRSRVPSCKGIPPCREGSTLQTKLPPKGSTSEYRTDQGFNRHSLGDTNSPGQHGNHVLQHFLCTHRHKTKYFIMLTAQEDVGSRSVASSILQMKTESEKLNCPKTQWLIKATLGFKHGPPPPSMP